MSAKVTSLKVLEDDKTYFKEKVEEETTDHIQVTVIV